MLSQERFLMHGQALSKAIVSDWAHFDTSDLSDIASSADTTGLALGCGEPDPEMRAE